MTKIAIRKIAVAVAAFFVSALPALSSNYGPRTLIGDVYQQTSTTESPDGINLASCDNVSHCYIVFQPVLGQRQIIIEHASCWVFSSDATAKLGQVELKSRRDTEIQFRNTFLIPYDANGFSWLVSGTVLHPLDTTDRPLMFFQFDKVGLNISAECTISGHVVTP